MPKRSRKTDRDRLMTLVTLTSRKRHPSGRKYSLYTQKEMAESLGISTRTLRRLKNVPGYDLSAKTYKRIRENIRRQERRAVRYIHKVFSIPKTPVLDYPMQFFSKEKRTETLVFDTRFWNARDIARFLNDAALTGRFIAWTPRIEVPSGVAISGSLRRDGKPQPSDINIEDDPIYYTAGPYSISSKVDALDAADRVMFHHDAGRNIVGISLVVKSGK